MTYIPSLNKVQIAPETVYADGTTATIQVPGITNCRLDPKVEVEQLIDKRGTTMPSHEGFVKNRWSEGILEGYVNFQEFFHYLDGMFGEATAVGDVRTYSGSSNWNDVTEASLALRYGQADQIYLASGILPYELRLAGATNEALTFGYRFFARPIADTGVTFNAALSDDTVEWAFGHDTEVYLDAGADAEPGATLLTDIAFRFEATITSNRKPVWHLGDQVHDSWRNGKWGGSFKLVLEASGTSIGYLGDILDASGTPQSFAIRVRTTDGDNILDLDFVGTVVTAPTLIPDLDGVVTVELDLVPTYGSHANILSCWGAELTIGS